jgi:hypothetical protein
MADKKISALTASTTPLAGTEVLPIVQSGATVKVAVSDLTAGRAISATQLTLTTGNLIVASGKGIDFSATAGTGTSELLADYEEGTWTPAFTSTGLTVTYTTQSGKYTKVGNIVNASFYIKVASNSGTLTNALGLLGLPFTAITGTDYGFSCAIGVHQFTLTPSMFLGANAVKIEIYQNGTITALTGAALTNGFYLGTITYQTN